MLKIWKPEIKISSSKDEYNKLVARFKKAVAFLDDNTIPIEEREKHVPRFLELVKEMDRLIYKIEADGHVMSITEKMEGFK